MSHKVYDYLIEEYGSSNRVNEFGIKRAISVIFGVDNPSSIMVGEVIHEMVSGGMLIFKDEKDRMKDYEIVSSKKRKSLEMKMELV